MKKYSEAIRSYEAKLKVTRHILIVRAVVRLRRMRQLQLSEHILALWLLKRLKQMHRPNWSRASGRC